MEMKRCLFCDKIVPLQPQGDYDRYVGCSCAPGGFYSLKRDSYDLYHELSYQEKRQWFPILSGYIRETTDCNETVLLSFADLESVINSPRIPGTMDEKAGRLLLYLHRNSSAPGDPVIIHRLSESCNLTYSPNLQELVYIIEKLKDELLIERIGTTFKLTESGWREAAARAGGKRLKPCLVYLPNEEQLREEWKENVLPKLEQCGYLPRMSDDLQAESSGEDTVRLISECKLILADIASGEPEIYFAAGFALGMQIPVILTVNRLNADNLRVRIKQIQPYVWEKTEDVAAMMQRRLNV
ncbi:hypothetical protein KZ483_14150 [Paenibacillus sp. sptzw28]|uniref:hypothetical protein n=1 Tax=Paenibacillus sp. sptzw28 TaxID=715179 RepID=UPI001C6F34B5|nr:hypothetical protein [Paenibacillus sp. sptzw28]QYR19117.1 hypothetical protein KZ483_14150 [Paenibacillus sp. sptzw28]